MPPTSRKKTEAILTFDQETCKTIVTDYLNENVNDPIKLQVVKVAKPIPIAEAYRWDGGKRGDAVQAKPLGLIAPGFWILVDVKGTSVAVKFRSTNALGALT